MKPALPQLNGFTIGQLLGQGGMSTVWEARQHSLERDVALKMLDPALSRDPADVKRFVIEARLAATLAHVNLVRVFDVASQNGLYFYIMELVRGYDADKWLRRKGRIEATETLAVAESIAVALEYAGTQVGLIHCDIKPGNIMVDADGTVKLTDLGVARCLRGRNRGDTVENDISGTPAYMAPEQVTGASPLDCRTDMYALGATLYHMVTGRQLFPGLPDDQVMESQCSGQAPDARDFVPELSAPYVALLEKLLAKNPVCRPRNWHAALRDMRQVRRGQFPIGEPPPAGVSAMHRHKPAARLVTDDAPRTGAGDVRRRMRDRLGCLPDVCVLSRWVILLLAALVFLTGFAIVLLLLRRS
jgi:eukaryotic-like serine/threonine-protein kinase